MFLFGVYEKIGTCLLYFAKVVCMISTNPKLYFFGICDKFIKKLSCWNCCHASLHWGTDDVGDAIG